mgnify:CR=1 FL=1
MHHGQDSLSLGYLEELYQAYLQGGDQIPEQWRRYFADLAVVQRPEAEAGGESGAVSSRLAAAPAGVGPAREQLRWARMQERVDLLIRNYRARGHMAARVDPLGRPRPRPPELELQYHGFSPAELDLPCSTCTLRGANTQTLREVIQRLEESYCGAIGVQFMHIDDLEARDWLQRRLESADRRLRLGHDQQVRILGKLTDAVLFEEFVRTKYVGMKSFSLEGSETLIPLLDLAFDKLASQGVREIVLSMSHRGRLNVLANILGKSLRDIFREFEDVDAELFRNRGDVKYHLGHHNYFTTASGREVHLSLGFNPSHLEFVNPVTLGRCRGKQDRFGDSQRKVAAAVLIHGDAAFAGEGIVQETLNLSQLRHYEVGGAIHILINNQIGFTTPPEEARSCAYATDVTKMLQVPIFHVNGEDPEAVARAVDMALDFRAAFRRDVVIDMYCFRRWGHNEGDEPAFTQPQMYREIERRPTVREGYLKHLLQLGEVTAAEAEEIARRRQEILEQELSVARSEDYVHRPGTLESMWEGYMGQEERFVEDVPTGVERDQLARHLERLTSVPEDFHLHPKLGRVMNQRRAMAAGSAPLDWATAELLALASVAAEGYRVRLSGQDSQRGTFSQRHAVWHDVQDGRTYTPLQHISPDQAAVEVINSPLSEAGVLGFEYGYSLVFPDGLVLWEAQFGDFVNVAQVMVDQFIASAEDKWRHLSGLVLLLPHGFEGQGPEHSSARLERFLALAAEDNMQIVMPSTPAQYFHVLRRQVVRRWRKPLVVFTPKSLLRHPAVVSPLEHFTRGRFQRVLADGLSAGGPVSRILLCSGKIYYELLEARGKRQRLDIALARLEQFYPFPEAELAAILNTYPEGTPVVWVQEEPENMGAWPFLRFRCGDRLLGSYPLQGISRPASASPASGSGSAHRLEQHELIHQALA